MQNWLQSFLTVVLGSGAAFTIAQIVLDFRRHRRKRRDSVEYLALRLAFVLEGYAIACAEKQSDHSTAVEHDGQAGRLLGSVPEVPALPESDAYQFLDRSILNSVLDFPQRVVMADRFAAFWWDTVGDLDSFRSEIGSQTIRMGHLAAVLAKRVRTTYRIQGRPLVLGTWDIGKYLEDEVRKLDETKRRNEVEKDQLDP
ncbi:MAG: hypothetical protein WDN08_21905 [Rhizomicrobium sp.]